ncbi:MAG: endonuclease [Citricoccus sp.]|nr:endonuclease [Citricoccus sp. WCRC_4]
MSEAVSSVGCMDEANGSRHAMDGGDTCGRASDPASSGALTSASSTAWAGLLDEAERLSQLVEALGAVPAAIAEAEAVDWIRGLERVKAACAAAQALQTQALHAMRCAEEAARGVPAADRGRGIAAEVALARRESPSRGSRELGVARALVDDMPCTRDALRRGEISEYKASLMVKETSWLPRQERRAVDALMAGRMAELGNHRLAGEARAHAQRLDPAAAVKHTDRAVNERRVSVRPAPGGMAYLSALLPMKQAVACLANLKRTAATTTGTGQAAERTQDQVMADLLVERVTGQSTADDVPVEVHLVMTDSTLLGEDGMPAWLVGHGPIPAGSTRDAVRDTDADVFIRRLYTEPDTGQLVGMDSRRRGFTGLLRRLIILRDDTCRTPWCDAPVRHIDHATPVREGGATSFDNASGLCVRCNYTKEHRGWTHRVGSGGLEVRTPTGHGYLAATGPLIPSVRPADRTDPPCITPSSASTEPPGLTASRCTSDRHRGKPIPMEAADIQLPPRLPDDPWVPVPHGISLPEAHLALYLAAA